MSLVEFLAEAELSHYHNALRNELKVTCVEHLKYVKEEDLEGIGMTRPEMRRLRKFYKKEHPQGTFGKLKRAIMRGGGEGTAGRSLSPSPPEHRISRPVSSIVRPPGKQLIPLDSISVNKTLGEGEFGVVQQGVWTTENGEKVQVAVKCLSKERMQNGVQEFLKEAAIMQSVDHENIVRMYGVVLDKDNSLMMVTELAPMRSLIECLKEPSLRLDFPVPRLCDFAQQVCDGMSYLESKRLIHRDLAARNILVFSKSKVKISDVGLSRALGVGKDYYQSKFSINLKLPIAWCAPECINYLKFTSASDVWSYGVTLWEFFTYGFQPWAGLNGQQILEAVDQPSCQRLEQPDLCPKEYYAVMCKCWEHDPEKRPTFSQLFLTLPQIRPVQVKAVKDYPSPTVEKDYLHYKNYDIIIVLDKSPKNAPEPGLWKGCLSSGKYGFFNPSNTVPYVEPKTSPISLPKTSLTRKGRKSGRKIRADMIGAPQNDLRHTGHIGYDGAVFGDVSFIGDNYDKLPLKVAGTDSPDRNGFVKSSTSDDSLNKRGTNGYGHSWISQESLASTQTDEAPEGYQDIDDNSIFADFKMPDLSSSFDFGPSFMDEVLKALDEKEKQAEAASTPSSNGRGFDDSGIDASRVDLGDKTPVAEEKTPTFGEEKGPMPKPRLDPKKSELPVPRPRPEIHRVEPIRRPPDSPDLPVKDDKESHIPLAAARKEGHTGSKEREREQLKKTIEIVRMESPAKEETASSYTEDRGEWEARESTPDQDSDGMKSSSASESQESASKVTSSLFTEDFSEPSPREIMSKLARESRMRRNLDHQRVLTGESADSQAASVTRARREPQGIPGKTSSIISAGSEDGEKDEEEVDTNPLRMLRGGAIPIRASRGASGRQPSRESRSALDTHDYCGVDESTMLGSSDSVFHSSRQEPTHSSTPSHPTHLHLSRIPHFVGKTSSGRCRGKFAPHSVDCSLEQLGFFNQQDPFWVQTVQLPDVGERTLSEDTTHSSEEVSPLLLVNYKNSDNVSYEDLLDFGLARQKNLEEIETLQRILDNEVSGEECRTVLEETRWDLGQAFKYVRLKQLLSLHLADIHTCKRTLMNHGWDVHRAADYLLKLQQQQQELLSSPESVDV
nr:hypothetical protein BaRGS_015098 [Batillaria attramentaria]